MRQKVGRGRGWMLRRPWWCRIEPIREGSVGCRWRCAKGVYCSMGSVRARRPP